MNDLAADRVGPSPAEPVPAEFDLLCDGCGYSLIGLMDSNRCPECGKEFYPSDPPLARVPWLHRAQLGWWRAYSRTVVYVLRDPRAFALELGRPVRTSAEDARVFRRWTIALATLSVLLPALMHLTGTIVQLSPASSRPAHFAATVIVLAGIGFGSCLSFTLATDATLFLYMGTNPISFHLRSGYRYAAAPLALMPIFALLAMGVHAAANMWSRSMGFQCMAVTIIVLMAYQLFLICRTTLVLISHGVTTWKRIRLGAFILYLLVHWALAILVGSMAGGLVIVMGFMLLKGMAG